MTDMNICTSENDCKSGRTGAYFEEQRTGYNVNSAINGVSLFFDLLKLKR